MPSDRSHSNDAWPSPMNSTTSATRTPVAPWPPRCAVLVMTSLPIPWSPIPRSGDASGCPNRGISSRNVQMPGTSGRLSRRGGSARMLVRHHHPRAGCPRGSGHRCQGISPEFPGCGWLCAPVGDRANLAPTPIPERRRRRAHPPQNPLPGLGAGRPDRRGRARGLLPRRGDRAAPAAERRRRRPRCASGYFPNITHAPALIGVKKDFFAQELGSTKLTTQTFNAGPDEVNALLGGSLDIALHRLRPGDQRLRQVQGQAIRLIAGATSGGAQLVVKPGHHQRPSSSRARTIATPQLANTQDVALKKWLEGQQPADRRRPGRGQDRQPRQPTHARRLQDRARSTAAGCPSRGRSRLVLDAGAKVLVDEKTLWPDGQFPTTVVIVRTEFLQQHPDTVAALLRGQLAAIDFATADPAEAKTVANDALKELTGSGARAGGARPRVHRASARPPTRSPRRSRSWRRTRHRGRAPKRGRRSRASSTSARSTTCSQAAGPARRGRRRTGRASTRRGTPMTATLPTGRTSPAPARPRCDLDGVAQDLRRRPAARSPRSTAST